MPFALTDEQKLLQESVDRFVERDYGFDVRTRLAESERGWSAENWSRFAELGWLGVPFGESAGGYGGGPVEAGLIAEGLGQGLAVEPYLWTVVLGGGVLARAGRNDLLQELIAGNLQLATGFAEPQARYALHDCGDEGGAQRRWLCAERAKGRRFQRAVRRPADRAGAHRGRADRKRAASPCSSCRPAPTASPCAPTGQWTTDGRPK